MRRSCASTRSRDEDDATPKASPASQAAATSCSTPAHGGRRSRVSPAISAARSASRSKPDPTCCRRCSSGWRWVPTKSRHTSAGSSRPWRRYASRTSSSHGVSVSTIIPSKSNISARTAIVECRSYRRHDRDDRACPLPSKGWLCPAFLHTLMVDTSALVAIMGRFRSAFACSVARAAHDCRSGVRKGFTRLAPQAAKSWMLRVASVSECVSAVAAIRLSRTAMVVPATRI